jgi:hypothetical protein
LNAHASGVRHGILHAIVECHKLCAISGLRLTVLNCKQHAEEDEYVIKMCHFTDVVIVCHL